MWSWRPFAAVLLGACIVASCTVGPGTTSSVETAPTPTSTAVDASAPTTAFPPTASQVASAPTASSDTAELPPGAEWVPGTHVALVPPDGFTAASVWTGFAHRQSSASIVVAELPGSFAETAPPPDHPGYADQGITIDRREELTIDGFEALLLEGEQDTVGPSVGKVILVIGTDEVTALLTGNFPLGDGEIGEQLRAAFLDVHFAPDGPAAAGPELRYGIVPAPPLRLASTLMGSGVYNESGSLPSADKLEMSLIVAPSFDAPVPGDAEQFAISRHEQTPGFEGIGVDDTRTITVAGAEAIELVGTGRDDDGEEAMVIYTVLVVEETRYVLFSGWCRETVRAECLETMRATIDTYRPEP